MRTISQVLDHAKTVQKVKSDYKLALCLGIGESSLSAYRNGRGLPDEINCKKLADAMGEDPALLTVQMQAQRAKTDEARDIWIGIAKRLQTGFASLTILVMVAIVSIAASALIAWTSASLSPISHAIGVYYVNQQKQARIPFFKFLVKFCKFLWSILEPSKCLRF